VKGAPVSVRALLCEKRIRCVPYVVTGACVCRCRSPFPQPAAIENDSATACTHVWAQGQRVAQTQACTRVGGVSERQLVVAPTPPPPCLSLARARNEITRKNALSLPCCRRERGRVSRVRCVRAIPIGQEVDRQGYQRSQGVRTRCAAFWYAVTSVTQTNDSFPSVGART